MKIHFVGINGVSMRVLAQLCLKRGHVVTGSDKELGGHDPSRVDSADMVVYTCAVGEDNCEVLRARSLGKTVYERAEFLAIVASEFDCTIAVAGTHGKTTVTSMLREVFATRCPTVHVGVEKNEKSIVNARGCGSVSLCITPPCANLFITEACEYKRNFLHLNPSIALILNAEFDHPDYYVDKKDYFSAFESFASKSSKCIIFGDDKRLFELCKKVGGVSFGFEKYNDYYVDNIVTSCSGKSFDIFYRGEFVQKVNLTVFGNHNVFNALASYVCGVEYGLKSEKISSSLATFSCPMRRGEKIGELNSCAVFSDYAHHPSEIRCAIALVKEAFCGQVTVIFQPHTYTRTQSLYGEFADALSDADTILLMPIYPAREEKIEGVDSLLIKNEIEKSGKKACHFDDCVQLFDYVDRLSQTQKTTFLFLGAGDIDKKAREFIQR